MKFEKFRDTVGMQVAGYEKLEALNEVTGIDLSEFLVNWDVPIDNLWSEVLTKRGKELLDWFLWDNGYVFDGIGSEDILYDKNGEIVGNTLKEFYNYLKDNNLFRRDKKLQSS
jgi:hypothetical protein